MGKQQSFDALRLLGGCLCIDFVNTIEDRTGENPEDFLTTYSGLVGWSQHAGFLEESNVNQLMELAGGAESKAHVILEQALEFRAALYRVLLAIAQHQEPNAGDLKLVQAVYEQAIANARLAAEDDHFVWDWRTSTAQLDQMLWPVALSAIKLLTEGDLRRVKACANPYGCGWLFYDNSKNLSRRWCSMEGCGSRVKMRRHYAKQRANKSML